MAISNDLMMAILAMDSYNRGYGEGITGLGGLGSRIGTAEFKAQSDIRTSSAEVAAGFYAASYTLNGQTVMSYRGAR